MIRFTSKIERAVAEATEEALKKGREEAAEKGTSFDEPPPPDPENGTGK